MIKAIVERDKKDYWLSFISDLNRTLTACALDVQRFLASPPPKKEKRLGGPLPGGFYSDKQRRYVFWAIGEGHIVVPYQRTGDLPRAWTVGTVTLAGDFMSVEVYSDPSLAPYNVYVQEPKTRPEMHSDWPSPDLAKEKLSGQIESRLLSVGREYGFR